MMKAIYRLFLLGTLILLSACASHSPTPSGGIIIDSKGVDMQSYYQDLDECGNYASQVNTGSKVTGKTISGAVIGGALGAITGDSDTAKRAADIDGLLGAINGSSQHSLQPKNRL